MTTSQMQEEILRIKKEKDICILAHAYQSHDIVEVADYVGDSFGLSQQAAKSDCGTVIMCGVRFMAETVKILSPEKRVILSAPNAGCPMAEQMTVADVENMKKQYPGYQVVAYINTTAELKTVCDVCVTSASALKICQNLGTDRIIFIPDINLGSYIKSKLPHLDIKLFDGGCPIHGHMTSENAAAAKRDHPDALLLVHPECPPEVTKQADFIGSTTAIMKFARESDATEFIIGTENSIAEHLQYELPEKQFYPLSKCMICTDMKLTTLPDVYNCVVGNGGEEISLSADVMKGARRCIDRMLRLG